MPTLWGLLWGGLAGLGVASLSEIFLAAEALHAAGGGCGPWWRCWAQAGARGLRNLRRPRALLSVLLLALYGAWLARTPTPWGFTPLLLSGAYFALVAVVDAVSHLVPYEEALLGLALGLALGPPRHGWLATVEGILGGLIIMGAFYLLGERFALWQARRRGEAAPEEPALGFGDVYLSGVLGAFLGWPGVLAGLILGALLMGGFILALALVLALRRQGLRGLGGRYLPMGPFLVLAAWWLMVAA